MSSILLRQHGRDVHAGRVVPAEERLVGLLRVVAIEPVDDVRGDFLVHRLRALERERAFVLAHLVLGRAVGGLHPQDRPRSGHADAVLGVDLARRVRDAGNRNHLHRRHDGLLVRAAVDVREAHLLHRVQVIEVAPEFLEPVRRRQRIRMIAEVVLAELAGGVAEVEQELGEARRAGAQIRNRARQLRQDHARAVRVHAGDERAAPGGATRLGVVVHEHAAFVGDAIDVRRFADHQAAVIAARLHPADVVAHDEQDVRLFACAGVSSLLSPIFSASLLLLRHFAHQLPRIAAAVVSSNNPRLTTLLFIASPFHSNFVLFYVCCPNVTNFLVFVCLPQIRSAQRTNGDWRDWNKRRTINAGIRVTASVSTTCCASIRIGRQRHSDNVDKQGTIAAVCGRSAFQHANVIREVTALHTRIAKHHHDIRNFVSVVLTDQRQKRRWADRARSCLFLPTTLESFSPSAYVRRYARVDRRNRR